MWVWYQGSLIEWHISYYINAHLNNIIYGNVWTSGKNDYLNILTQNPHEGYFKLASNILMNDLWDKII